MRINRYLKPCTKEKLEHWRKFQEIIEMVVLQSLLRRKRYHAKRITTMLSCIDSFTLAPPVKSSFSIITFSLFITREHQQLPNSFTLLSTITENLSLFELFDERNHVTHLNLFQNASKRKNERVVIFLSYPSSVYRTNSC